MPTEIEVKYVVTEQSFNELLAAGVLQNGTPIKQGYLNSDKDRTVRVRVYGSEAFITVKGASEGISRKEFEYPIPVREAEEMLKLCETSLSKTRFLVTHNGDQWEVDVFEDHLEGIVVAELELEYSDQAYMLPSWCGQDVSRDPQFYNSRMATKRPVIVDYLKVIQETAIAYDKKRKRVNRRCEWLKGFVETRGFDEFNKLIKKVLAKVTAPCHQGPLYWRLTIIQETLFDFAEKYGDEFPHKEYDHLFSYESYFFGKRHRQGSSIYIFHESKL